MVRNMHAPVPPRLIWGNLLHLSYNMWSDRSVPELERKFTCYKPFLRFDDRLWRDLLRRMAAAGMNMVVIDLGDGVRYESHPEIAVPMPGTRPVSAGNWPGSGAWASNRFPS